MICKYKDNCTHFDDVNSEACRNDSMARGYCGIYKSNDTINNTIIGINDKRGKRTLITKILNVK